MIEPFLCIVHIHTRKQTDGKIPEHHGMDIQILTLCEDCSYETLWNRLIHPNILQSALNFLNLDPFLDVIRVGHIACG